MRSRLGWPWATCIATLSAFGCGDGVGDATFETSVETVDAADGEAVDTAEGGDVVDAVPTALTYAPCEVATRVGLFTIALAVDYTSVDGRVANGVVPANVREETDVEGGCRLMQGRELNCVPGCVSGDTCDATGTCIPYPTAKSVGAVSVAGLSVPLSMTPTSLGAYSNAATTIPHPGFGEGDVLSLVAPGDVLPGFSLEGRGVAGLVVAEADVTLVRDAALTVDWTPGVDASARIRFVLDIAHHGGIAASLECDGVADADGHFELPARLVSALLDIGVAGYPTLTVSRRTADSETIAPGCVELAVVSEVVLPVLVPGVTSCSTDEDCAEGTTCQADLTCR